MLNLETLELRRLHFDLSFYYKIFNHLTPFDPESDFTIYIPPSSLRRNSAVIKKPLRSSDKPISDLFFRHIDAWNSLPSEVRSLPTLDSFKRRIKSIDLSGYLIGYKC
jgi:hypothetical protein